MEKKRLSMLLVAVVVLSIIAFWTPKVSAAVYYFTNPINIVIDSTAHGDGYSRYHCVTIDDPIPTVFWKGDWYNAHKDRVWIRSGSFHREETYTLSSGPHTLEYAVSCYVGHWDVTMKINGELVASGEATVDIHISAPFGVCYDDSDQKEVAVWWVQDYRTWRDPDLESLSWTEENAHGFYVNLDGWTRRWEMGDDPNPHEVPPWAWEKHWEKQSKGGTDYAYVDAVDFVWFSGHGCTSAFCFGDDRDGDGVYTQEVYSMSPSSCEVEWGNGDLEWIVLDACEVLAAGTAVNFWGCAFKGLHCIMGFDTPCYDCVIWYSPTYWKSGGRYFAEKLQEGKTMNAAWELTTKKWQPDDVWAAILAVQEPSGRIQWDDYLPGYGYVGPDVWNPSLKHRRWSCID